MHWSPISAFVPAGLFTARRASRQTRAMLVLFTFSLWAREGTRPTTQTW